MCLIENRFKDAKSDFQFSLILDPCYINLFGNNYFEILFKTFNSKSILWFYGEIIETCELLTVGKHLLLKKQRNRWKNRIYLQAKVPRQHILKVTEGATIKTEFENELKSKIRVNSMYFQSYYFRGILGICKIYCSQMSQCTILFLLLLKITNFENANRWSIFSLKIRSHVFLHQKNYYLMKLSFTLLI